MKICYGSDIHLEFDDSIAREKTKTAMLNSFKIPECDVLLLAGDILVVSKINSSTLSFLVECSNKCGAVYMIAGNHEHYHGILEETHKDLKELISDLGLSNIYLLENEVVEFGDYALFGGTFWTDFKQNDPVISLQVQMALRDFDVITMHKYKKLSTDEVVRLNNIARHKLLNFLRFKKAKYNIVMTHHAPSFLSAAEQYQFDDITYGYANTDLEKMFDGIAPDFWVHGHMHIAASYEWMNVQVRCNPHGYYGIERSTGYKFKQLK